MLWLVHRKNLGPFSDSDVRSCQDRHTARRAQIFQSTVCRLLRACGVGTTIAPAKISFKDTEENGHALLP